MNLKFLLLGVVSGITILGTMALGISAKPEPKRVTLTETNFVSIVGEVNEASISDVMIGISKSDPSKPLYLYLDTPGGEVFAGKKLVDYLHSTDRNIVCIASMAISMGFVTLQSCKTRLITRDGILMTHQIASQVKGSLHDIENQVSLLRKLELLYDTMISRRMELTLEAYQAKLNPEFWMIGHGEALKHKAVDGVVVVNCSASLEKKTSIKTLQTPFGDKEIKVNACPLL